jgi:hypothetical protein
LALALALFSSLASAEPTAAERDTARKLMEDARDKRDKKDFAGALESFKAADDIMHVPTTGFEVGVTLSQLGKLVEAREQLLAVTRIPKRDKEPAPFENARKNAAELYDALEPRIPTLRFEVHGAKAAQASVTVDGIAVAASVGKVGLRLNPGHHVVVAKERDRSVKEELDVEEKETKSIALELPPEKAAPPPAKPPEQPKSREMSPLTYAGFGVAGAGLVVGGVTGFMMFSKKSTLEDNCPDKKCGPDSHDDLDSAKTYATVSTVAFIVAGVGAGVGVVGLFLRPKEKEAAAVRVEPFIGAGSTGLRGSF